MQTLIELYDKRPLENVLGVETFRPERVIYICPEAAFADRKLKTRLQDYFAHRGLSPKILLEKVSVYDAEAVLHLLDGIAGRYPDCAIDITGGTDAVLFAVGLFCANRGIPVFTYSRRKNCFFDISNADFAQSIPCRLTFSVEDFFVMAGGSMRPGRVDNQALGACDGLIEPFFRVYLRHQKRWTDLVGYIQRLSPTGSDGSWSLHAAGGYVVKGERGSRITAPEEALRELEQIGLIQDLRIDPEQSVAFRFPNGLIRSFLRDVGSVLELYVYRACRCLGCFDDVRLSAVVDWEGSKGRDQVTNELDVVCTRGVLPLFISCKTCDARTEALNELAILRDRFGGQMARAAIVTATRGSTVLRNRAAELNITVIDLNDLVNDRLSRRLERLSK